ncbi:RcnB family protein [Phenylobacterium sp.]|uniref:RcnB family protein n=1 Tax=Phenylobacterium sp. TaxID=1871053 RepID=UPI002FE0B659
MKRLLLTLIAAATVAGPLPGSAAFAKDGDRGGRWEQRGGERGRGWETRQWRAADGPGRGRGQERRGARGDDRRDDRRGDRRFEDREEGGRNYYGPPPGAYAPPRAYGLRRGGYLPPEAQGSEVEDYGRYRLRPPPRGFRWMRVDGAYALVGPDGQIFDMIR